MRLLVYGGCHALVIKRLIDTLGVPGRHSVDLLINYHLIATRTPFPYDDLTLYDAVVYSPVENKQEYNTHLLDAACADAGVAAIRFPWLEWHGYTPGIRKGMFWSQHRWHFPELIGLSRRFADLPAFVAYVGDHYPSEATIADNFASSTNRLVSQEDRFACEVRVSDFILENYRDRRMFMIPDHPTLPLYRFLLRELERALGVRLVDAWPDDLPEPQPEELTPIFPRVAAALGLAFDGSGGGPLQARALEDLLALHFRLGQTCGAVA